MLKDSYESLKRHFVIGSEINWNGILNNLENFLEKEKNLESMNNSEITNVNIFIAYFPTFSSFFLFLLLFIM